MSKSFLSRTHAANCTDSQMSAGPAKTDPEAELKWLDYLAHPERANDPNVDYAADVQQYNRSNDVVQAKEPKVWNPAQSSGDYFPGMPPLENIWGDFPQKDFLALSKAGQTAHIFNAMRYSSKYGDGTVNIDRIFKKFDKNSSAMGQGFSSGHVDLTIGSKSFTVYLDFSIYSDRYGNYNPVIDFTGGTTVDRLINGSDWIFYKNSGYQWGTISDNFDYLYNWLGY